MAGGRAGKGRPSRREIKAQKKVRVIIIVEEWRNKTQGERWGQS